MSKRQGILLTILSLLSLGLSITSASLWFRLSGEARNAPRDIQYVLYLGTNDKDTNEAVYSPAEAKFHADDILIRHFRGFTIQEATGGWVEDNGVIAHEYTLVIYLSDTTLDKVHSAADELIKDFNQSSVLIQANETKTEFYSLQSNP